MILVWEAEMQVEAFMLRRTIRIRTASEGDVINLTEQVNAVITESGIRTGLVHLFVQHSTAALTTIEFEPGVLEDLRRALAVLAPDNATYAHNTRWGDSNGRSHVRASLMGPSLTVPVSEGSPMCGIWQQIVMLELDVNAGRERTIICTMTGE
jgi:secondary thiamine-phosphate synthase enzyme